MLYTVSITLPHNLTHKSVLVVPGWSYGHHYCKNTNTILLALSSFCLHACIRGIRCITTTALSTYTVGMPKLNWKLLGNVHVPKPMRMYIASVYKECPSLYTTCCAQIGHWLGHVYISKQFPCKLGHSNFYSSDTNRDQSFMWVLVHKPVFSCYNTGFGSVGKNSYILRCVKDWVRNGPSLRYAKKKFWE